MSTVRRRKLTLRNGPVLPATECWVAGCEDVTVMGYTRLRVIRECAKCGACDMKPRKAMMVVA